MIKHLVGRLDDGSRLANNLPASAATPVVLYSRTDVTLYLRVLNPQGVMFLPSYFSDMKLTVRQPLLGAAALISVAGVEGALNLGWSFTITDAQLADSRIQPGMYVYDIWATHSSGKRDVVLPLSAFHLQPTMGAAT